MVEPSKLDIATKIVNSARLAKDRLIAETLEKQDIMIRNLNKRIEELENKSSSVDLDIVTGAQ